MTLTFIIICLVLNFMNLGLIFLLYRAVGKLDESQMTLRKVFADIWKRRENYEAKLDDYFERYKELCNAMPERIDSFRAELKSTNLRMKDLSEHYDQYYENSYDIYKSVDHKLGNIMYNTDDISSMTADIWWAIDMDVPDELLDEEVAAAKEILEMLSEVGTGIDGIESGLRQHYPDAEVGYLLAPIRNRLQQMTEKVEGVKEAYDNSNEEDTAPEGSDGREEVPGVLEGASEEGLDGEEDRLEPWSEYDEVQGTPEGSEDNGEAGPWEY